MSSNSDGTINIGNNQIGGENPVFIIAEIGTSHDGDLKKAEELIISASEAGVNCVKFQYVIAKEIIHPKTGKVFLPGGEIPLYERFLQLERPQQFYAELKRITEENNLFFLCTPFGIESAKKLKQIGVEGFKIASPELNHYPLLKEVSNLPTILSTGVSTLGDIEKALLYTSKNTALLHCITSYPAPEEEYNLKLIHSMAKLFDMPVGISDHSKDPLLVPVISAALGGSIIEKHITLSRNGDGLDDPIAITPQEMEEMCKEVRVAENRDFSETFNWLTNLYRKNKIESIIGTGIKKLAPSEIKNYRTTNRSILAIKDIETGENFTEKNIALLRSEKELSPGLPPEYFTEVLKRTAVKNVNSGSGINWDHF
ncbi:MAG: N-acetylneuraminate synthase family protein [Spirochaetia bacterium]|jgi:sialic acid synthase SpsE|nr:N-acetylneuraminate synthase family protein [Spirochaetia bacterium]